MNFRTRGFYSVNGRNLVPIVVAISVMALAMGAGPARADGTDFTVQVLDNTPDHVVIDYGIDRFTTDAVTINGHKYAQIALGKESLMKTTGAPALPNIARSIIIPDDAEMVLNVLKSEYYELTNIDVVPSKGYIPRNVNPQDVPYTFGVEYGIDAFYPGNVAVLREPYILRDHRGVVVEVNPFQYNPVTHTLRVYTDVVVEVVAVGPGKVNVLTRGGFQKQLSLAFHTIYSHHFLNYTLPQRYDPLDETGDMLVIAYDAWIPNMQPFVDHKNARGIDTTIVGVSSIGNNPTAIKTHIQGVYDTSDLAFVLLVGDIAQIDSFTAVSGYNGASDPTYATLVGGDDYPEIIVGRFSAQSPDDVDTQVERTIGYETLPAVTQDWFWKGTGIASNQGVGDDGEYDNEHIDNIRDDLIEFGYTLVDQIYDPTASASHVTTALNNGRGIVNYCGHGGPTSWSTTGFSNSHVNALTNDNMLPFIVSVACNNGEFDSYTCFAEAWLRATHDGQPTGAVGCYASSISQPWSPPMEGQDEFNLLYVAEAYSSYGALCYAGSCSMMDDYPGSGNTWGTGPATFYTWHIFGDPSLRVSITCVDAGTIDLDKPKYACEDTANIQVIDCGLNTGDGVTDTVTVNVASDAEPGGESVILTEIDPASGQFAGSIDLSATNAVGILQVAEGNTVTATYIDADDGDGGYNVTVTDTASVDCIPPAISNVQTINIEPRNATVTFNTDEPANGTVHYGLGCGSPLWTASSAGYSTSPEVNLAGLQDSTRYYYTVEAQDEAGNSAEDDNNENCYTFVTPEVPDYFTEIFDGVDNDLDNLTLVFTPDGSNDYYRGCAEPITELPTDPAGGMALSFTDDDDGYATCNLTGGALVSIYGTTDSTFYPGTNGYITFVHGESDYTETLEEHFSGIPQISALYDDLNPEAGGTVSWKQLDDRAVVTWLNVPEWNTSNSNTFQIEMFFDGTIAISYLAISAADGLAGLSAGTGLDPDFLEMDLSAMGPCVPPDCNENGIPDDQDIAEGTSEDCNENEIPDECDVGEGGSSLDTNGNGIPDECEVAAPLVAAAGSRYLAVTPQPPGSELPIALYATGDVKEPDVGCVAAYVQADGTLGPVAVYQAPVAWGTVHVYGEEIIPISTYNVRAEWQGVPSADGRASTWRWGDTDGDELVNLDDIMRLIRAYQGELGDATLENVDHAPCLIDKLVGLDDIMAGITGFQGGSYLAKGCPAPCP